VIDRILDLWNQVMGSGIVEPTTWAIIAFVFIFIILPILCTYIGVKIAIWILNGLKDWWKQ
jgi:hypothetical protein